MKMITTAALSIAAILGFASPAAASPLYEQFAVDAQAGSAIYGSPTSGPDFFAIAAYAAADAPAASTAAPEITTSVAPVEATTDSATMLQMFLDRGLVVPNATTTAPATVASTDDVPAQAVDRVAQFQAYLADRFSSGKSAAPAVQREAVSTDANMVCTDTGGYYPTIKVYETTSFSDGSTAITRTITVRTPVRIDLTHTYTHRPTGKTWTISDVRTHAAIGDLPGFEFALCQIHS